MYSGSNGSVFAVAGSTGCSSRFRLPADDNTKRRWMGDGETSTKVYRILSIVFPLLVVAARPCRCLHSHAPTHKIVTPTKQDKSLSHVSVSKHLLCGISWFHRSRNGKSHGSNSRPSLSPVHRHCRLSNQELECMVCPTKSQARSAEQRMNKPKAPKPLMPAPAITVILP